MKNLFKSITIILSLLLIVACSEDKENKGKESGEGTTGEDLAGTWNGTINVPNQPLNIIVNFEDADELTGTISIPIQNLENFALSDIKLNKKKVSFDMPLPGQEISFYGTIEGKKMSGTFTQGGQSFPFELEKGNPTAQEPEEEDFLTIVTSEVTLYGSLMTPEGGEPSPIAIIIPGSGPTDRNGNSPGGKNNSLKMLAEGLAENGIASLRYDKRGAGKNTKAVGKEEDMRFDQFVHDASLWISTLDQDERFTNVIVIGHSQGSLVGMMAAENSNAAAFISIAGAGRSIDEVLSEQLKTLPTDLYKESQEILKELKQGETVEDVNPQLMNVFKPSVQPFLMSWMQYDPTEEITKIDLPTLIINGRHDIQVPVTDAEKLAKARPDAELSLIDEMNHVLKKAPKNREGNLATYSDPTLPLAEGLMSEIITFLKENNIQTK